MTMPGLLADTDGEWVYQLVVFLIVIVFMAAKALLEWLRRRQQAGAEPPSQQPQTTRSEPVRGQSVEEIVRTMRQARRPESTGRTQAPRQAKPIPQARAPQQLADRHVTPTALGQDVDAETARLARRLQQQRKQVATRVHNLPAGAEGAAVKGPRAILQISLDLDEARRGILYSEILGPPIALRKQQGMWDV